MMMGILLILMRLMLLIRLIDRKSKITGQTDDDGIINVETMVSLKYLSNFWKTLEMPLNNYEVELFLNWLANCVVIYSNAITKFLHLQ